MSKYPSDSHHREDDIQETISRMSATMPEVAEWLDQVEIPDPSSLSTVPMPSRTWRDRLGDWATLPGFQLPDLLARHGYSAAIILFPMLLGCVMTEAALLLYWFGKGL